METGVERVPSVRTNLSEPRGAFRVALSCRCEGEWVAAAATIGGAWAGGRGQDVG